MEKSEVTDFSAATEHSPSPGSFTGRVSAFIRRPHWDPPDDTWVVRRWPDLTGYCFATLFFWLSLTPSLLPRPWIMQGLLGGITGIAGYGVGSLLSTAARALARRLDRPFSAHLRKRGWQFIPLVLLVVSIAVVVWGARAQRGLQLLMGLSQSSTWNAGLIIGLSLGTFLFLLVLCRAVRLLARKLVAWFGRLVPLPLAYAAGLMVCATLVVVGTKNVLWDRGFIGFIDHVSRQANEGTEPGIHQPVSPRVSGSPQSLVSWSSLGTKGRTFVATAPTTQELTAFSGQPSLPPVRVYVGEQVEAADFTAAAALAVREMDRTGAWNRKVINLVGTTGSGWVDRNIPTPLEYMYNGDTATVALQYSYLPSWISFLVDKERAGHAARALYQAVHTRLLTIPADRRPRLVLSGESLGAYAVDSVFTSPQALIDGGDGVFFEGPPAASQVWQQIVGHRDRGSPIWRPIYQDGKSIRFGQWPRSDLKYPSSAPWDHPRVVFLQNASDPVVWWTPDLLTDKPAWASPPLGPDVSPQLRYYPIVSFWQTTVDLVVSFGMPPQHGHSYGTGACVGWAAVLPPPGWTAADTENLENVMAAINRNWS
ncbi:alpha/beta hydrolase [Catenulispora pinisilvae]|uniref:alpha/beta hydrolase n=1 Tax=Catenulispora pinisilvae TaxID=2705253 RepID=UPI001890FC7A|nr:alpha/beta-hydrolase family protein [Catenulispora pinisilvae]